MDKVEWEIKKSKGPRSARDQAQQISGGLSETKSNLLRHLQVTEQLIRERIESETLLIDDLKELASVHCGNIELRMSRTDMHEVIAWAMHHCQKELSEKRLDVALDPGARWHHVRGDDKRLEQVVTILLKNAIAFTPTVGTVRIATRNLGNSMEIAVTDNGVGIAPEALPHVFGAFESAVVDLDAVREGASLRVCKALVKIHGGEISVTSQGLGTGATFTVSLPTIDVD
jgi:signal transduction histidine kinase